MYLGVKAVLAKSIERIHRANLINFGIVPLIFDDPKDYDAIASGERMEFTDIRAAINGDGKVAIRAGGRTVSATAALSGREKELVLAGGLLASLK